MSDNRPDRDVVSGGIVDWSIETLLERLAEGEISAEETARAYLDRVADLDGKIGAYLIVDGDRAVEHAALLDRRRMAGEPMGALAGVPLGLKDILLTRGLQSTCASRILNGFTPPFDATVVSRLRAADAVFMGKLNLDEFAMGSSTENSGFQATANPWNLARTPGGSSGGSAAAVAARLCLGALGTDTGGSIRQPASFCGVVGLKPTYGRVSRFGVIAFASSLDQVGPLGRTVRDTARLYDVIAGHDPRDATSVTQAVEPAGPTLAKNGRLDGVTIGIPDEYFPDSGVEPDVAQAVRRAIEVLEGLGARPVEIRLPHTPYAIAAYYLVATAEASSNLARYDGVRFGHRANSADLQEMYANTRREGFGLEVKRRIMLGTFALSAGYYDAYYKKASQVRTSIRRDFDEAFSQVDAIVTPTSPTTAFRLGERLDDPLQMYLADIFTISCNLAGLPGVSIPCGFDAAGLPVGMQILGRPFDENGILKISAAYEDATDWTARRPDVGEGE